MKRLKIDTLDKLEAFVNNESVSLENRLSVFSQAMDNYPLFILEVKFDDTCTTIENRLEVQEQMKRVIADVKADPNQKSYRGFWVAYEHND
jgi:hypothetical protein